MQPDGTGWAIVAERESMVCLLCLAVLPVVGAPLWDFVCLCSPRTDVGWD
jgi:hypothetical protein